MVGGLVMVGWGIMQSYFHIQPNYGVEGLFWLGCVGVGVVKKFCIWFQFNQILYHVKVRKTSIRLYPSPNPYTRSAILLNYHDIFV